MDIFNYFEKKGIDTLDKSFYRMIAVWESWYKSKVKNFTFYRVYSGQGTYSRKQRKSLGMAKKLSEDIADLLLNERVQITLSDENTGRPRIVEAFGKVIDGAILFGTDKPASWRNDIVATATAAKTVVGLGAADNLYDKIMGEDGSIAMVENSGYFVNGHMADISMRAKLRGLKNANGDPLFKSDMQSSTTYSLDGSPMNFPNNGAFDKSKALMISGDFSQLVYAIRQDITFKLFTEGVVQNTDGTIAYNLMQNDMVALRAVMRLGWEIPNPINSLQKDKTKRCPFSVLKAGE